jgi:multidrug efflux system membrane fusion protein
LKEGQPPVDPVELKNAGGGYPANLNEQNKSNYYVAAQPVKVELTEGTQVILSAGVKPGDQIVVDGQEKLKNGSRVIPRQASANGTTAEMNETDAVAGQPS